MQNRKKVKKTNSLKLIFMFYHISFFRDQCSFSSLHDLPQRTVLSSKGLQKRLRLQSCTYRDLAWSSIYLLWRYSFDANKYFPHIFHSVLHTPIVEFMVCLFVFVFYPVSPWGVHQVSPLLETSFLCSCVCSFVRSFIWHLVSKSGPHDMIHYFWSLF